MSSRPAWGLLVRGSSPAWLTSGVSWAILPPQVSTADMIRMLSTLGGNMQCKQRAVPGGIHTLHDAMHGAIQGARQLPAGFCCMISRASALLPVVQSTRYARGALI